MNITKIYGIIWEGPGGDQDHMVLAVTDPDRIRRTLKL